METVIIGSGKTGRGFIAPFLHRNQCKITFVDKDPHLINKLVKESYYTVYYFENKQNDYRISDFNSYVINDEKAMNAIINADIIFTSIYANNLSSLIDTLKIAIDKRVKKDDLIIICCENGINVKQPLINSGLKAIISEGIIFSTTVEIEDSLDLISEPYPELPVDNSKKNLNLDIPGIKLIDNFPKLIKRKIYTYNFMSALIGYLGNYKDYRLLSDAANDIEINYLIEQVSLPLSSSIAEELDVPFDEQFEFMRRAVDKFKNLQIKDSIKRNIIQVDRKLGTMERLLRPLSMFKKYGKDNGILLLVISAAINYGLEHEKLNKEKQFKRLSLIINENELNKVEILLEDMQRKKDFSEILLKIRL